jgi:hypothetical protein
LFYFGQSAVKRNLQPPRADGRRSLGQSKEDDDEEEKLSIEMGSRVGR